MKYFTMEELCYSAKAVELGIKNEPDALVKAKMIAFVENVLDKARARFGKPIVVNSGYRCAELNKAVGGSATSQHQKGEAVDITAQDKADNAILWDILCDIGKYDQLIWEKGNDAHPQWIHISYREPMRMQKLRTRDGIHYTLL